MKLNKFLQKLIKFRSYNMLTKRAQNILCRPTNIQHYYTSKHYVNKTHSKMVIIYILFLRKIGYIN